MYMPSTVSIADFLNIASYLKHHAKLNFAIRSGTHRCLSVCEQFNNLPVQITLGELTDDFVPKNENGIMSSLYF